MFGLQKENKNNKKRLKELILRSEEQEARFKQIYEENNISIDEMLTFLANPENFDSETWEAMEQLRKEDQAEIQRQFNTIQDPEKTEESYNKLRKTQQWITI